MVLGEGLLVKAGESFVKEAYSAVKNKAVKKWQSFNWHTAQGWYYQKIEKDYGTTRVLGKSEPIDIKGIFTDVYLLNKPTAYKRFDIFKLRQDPNSLDNEINRLSSLDLIKNGTYPRLYVLGKPGAGKTTFLKYIALKASEGEINRIPIFVSLKEWADSNLELMAFLVKEFDICRFPESQPLIEYILDMGLAIVLFDGLDETNLEEGKRDKIIGDIRDFSRKYDSSHIVVTCRIAATNYTFEQFSYLEIADFSKKQAEQYINKWFSHDLEKQINFHKEFNNRDNERLREMSNTPLLLSLLCLNFEETGSFPNRRVELYEEGINALLHKWDASRSIRRDNIYKGLSLGRKRQMFTQIAAQTFEKKEIFFQKNILVKMIVDYLIKLPESPNKEEIDGEVILKSIEAQHGILIERAKNIYSFSHLTFQEYFTAKFITDNNLNNTLKHLLDPKIVIDNHWLEVILIVAGLLNNADFFIETFFKTVNSFVTDDEYLAKFFKWVDTKALDMNLKTRIAGTRFSYILLSVCFSPTSHYLFNNLSNLAKSLSQICPSIAIFIDDIHNLKNLNTAFNIKLSLEVNIDFKLMSIYFMALRFEKEWMFHSVRDLQQPFLEFWYDLKDDTKLSSNINFIKEFNKISLPASEYTAEDWKNLSTKLLYIIKNFRFVEIDRTFSNEQINKLNNYFRVNKLLIDCLNSAAISDRYAVEDRLLCLPQ